MKWFYGVILSVLFLLMPVPVSGQEPAATEGPKPPDVTRVTSDADDAENIEAAKKEYLELVDGKVKINDLVVEGSEVYEAVQAMREAKKSGKGINMALIVMALAALFKFLLSILKMAVASGFWSTRKGKTVTRLTTIGLGIAAMFVAKLGMGMGWGDALLLFMSGPGAMAFNESVDIFTGAKDAKDEAKPEEAPADEAAPAEEEDDKEG